MENIKTRNFKIFEVTKEFLKANDKEMIKGSLLLASIYTIIFSISIFSTFIRLGFISFLLSFTAPIANIFVVIYLGASIKIIAANWYFNNHKINLKDAYNSLDGKKMIILISDLIKCIKIMLWSCLLVIPGYYHLFAYIFNQDFILFGNKEASDSIKLSKENSKGHLLELFIFVIITALTLVIPIFFINIINILLLKMKLIILLPIVLFAISFISLMSFVFINAGVTMKFIEICKEKNINIKIGNKNLSDEDNKNGQIN